jgi:cytochrome c peroxidase
LRNIDTRAAHFLLTGGPAARTLDHQLQLAAHSFNDPNPIEGESVKTRFAIPAMLLGLAVLSILAGRANAGACRDPIDAPAAVQVGDRLFRETRFAQFFFAFLQASPKRTVNTVLRPGDPTVKFEQNAAGKPIRDPFRNQSMNCRNCHLGNDLLGVSHFDGRTYADFASRSPIPPRADGLMTTPRNAQSLVSVSIPREVPFLFHFDGEFASIQDLTLSTLTGRNFGWLPSEFATAEAHIINVIKNDNGHSALARRYGCGGFPYSVVLKGTDPRLPASLVLPEQYRIDVTDPGTTDDEIMQDIGALILAYMNSIAFNLDEPPSPYDVFLAKNDLPTAPNQGETNLAYAQRLLGLIDALSNPLFVTQPKDGTLRLHKGQKFQFGALELQGLKVFFTQATSPPASLGGAGNCIACHTPPAFTDNLFHNTAVAELEYDNIEWHAFGGFANLAAALPNLEDRNNNFDLYLPPTPNHPNASGRFRSPALVDHPNLADLGVWNIVGNPDLPNPQSALAQILCAEFNLTGDNCTPDNLLPKTIGFFKTPSVRDTGQSAPYMHNGSLNTVPDVLDFYFTIPGEAAVNSFYNTSPEFKNVFINGDDLTPLNAFLNSLNEDYK